MIWARVILSTNDGGRHIPRSPGYLAPLFGLLFAEFKHTRARSNSTQPYVHAHNLVMVPHPPPFVKLTHCLPPSSMRPPPASLHRSLPYAFSRTHPPPPLPTVPGDDWWPPGFVCSDYSLRSQTSVLARPLSFAPAYPQQILHNPADQNHVEHTHEAV